MSAKADLVGYPVRQPAVDSEAFRQAYRKPVGGGFDY